MKQCKKQEEAGTTLLMRTSPDVVRTTWFHQEGRGWCPTVYEHLANLSAWVFFFYKITIPASREWLRWSLIPQMTDQACTAFRQNVGRKGRPGWSQDSWSLGAGSVDENTEYRYEWVQSGSHASWVPKHCQYRGDLSRGPVRAHIRWGQLTVDTLTECKKMFITIGTIYMFVFKICGKYKRTWHTCMWFKFEMWNWL